MATADTRKAMLTNNLQMAWSQLIKRLAAIRYRGQPPNQAACNKLQEVPAEERAEFIDQNWGKPALEKNADILARIESLETEIVNISA